MNYDSSFYYVDFTNREELTEDEKAALEKIQKTYRPIERAEFLVEYKVNGKITNDDFETMTGIPYTYGN
jgi:hypothetical protein